MDTPKLTTEQLLIEAEKFCIKISSEAHKELIGITDGKAVGTYIEALFKKWLASNYILEQGNAANGIDLPSMDINTDIKTTSITQPQSSSPFKSVRQKVYGLGYNLLVFVYQKNDAVENNVTILHNVYVNKDRTGDYTLTKRLIEMVGDGANEEDIIAYFMDKNLPADDIQLSILAKEVLELPPTLGYLTISNALQWRLQYQRLVTLKDQVEGIHRIYDYK